LKLEVGLGRIPVRRPLVDAVNDQEIALPGEGIVGAVRGRGYGYRAELALL
jgi:hypothetical protein